MHHMRKSGILMHPTAIPGPGGIGSLGKEARDFIDFLHSSNQTLWQVLPLGPTGYSNSPYSCYSAFAGNPLLINLSLIVDEGDLHHRELAENFPPDRIDYEGVAEHKFALLRLAYGRFIASEDQGRKQEFWSFCDSSFWLHDFALFMACKEHFRGKVWSQWPSELQRRNIDACCRYSEKLGTLVGEQKYMQWQFSRQWQSLKAYANDHGISVFGDMPIFVAYDSADVWCNQHFFQLDLQGKPHVVAGVPPDYFSKTGQRWGNPLYDWARMAEDNYNWWVSRLRGDLGLYDLVRIDHFRGFEAYWEIPAREKTAVKGQWVKGPGESFFRSVNNALGRLPLIAEDLGVITPEVESLRDLFGLPGMKILQFAFDSGADNPYLPHNYTTQSVVYTGTHDNDTTSGWFSKLPPKQQQRVCAYLRCNPEDIAWEMIRAALSSVSQYAILPMQDLLGLDTAARMNVPGVPGGNWGWRTSCKAFSADLSQRLGEMSRNYNRAGVV